MKPRKALPRGLVFAACIAALPAVGYSDGFSLTGQYEGLYACDSTTAGVPSTWSRPLTAGIVQDGDSFTIDLRYTDKQELGAEYSLYSGQIAQSDENKLVSGYFEACGGSFPSKELARIFPTAVQSDPFALSVTSVWVSDQVPNIPGLTVQICKWSLTRVSTDTPTNRPCETGQ
ncbi:MAG: hypothetical protein AAGC86_00785 [Pseudomonadota bacterium]